MHSFAEPACDTNVYHYILSLIMLENICILLHCQHFSCHSFPVRSYGDHDFLVFTIPPSLTRGLNYTKDHMVVINKKDKGLCMARYEHRHDSNTLRVGIAMSVLLIVCVILAGCATKIKVDMLQPAPYHEASTTKRIAVLPFSGPQGESFASELEGLIGNIYINGARYFTLVDRTAIDKTMGELQLSMSGAIDETTAAQVGRMVGAEGIYTGRITVSKCTDNPFTRSRRECLEREIKYDKNGNAYQGKCLRWRNYTVRCTKRDAYFSCSPKLIEVATGRIIYSRNLSGTASSSGCKDTTPARGKTELIEAAKSIVKMQLRNDIAPTRFTQEITLMDSKAGITSKDAKKKLKQGIAYARKERLDAACELWQEAGTLAPESPSIFYNLGVCAEINGDYTAALRLYKKADNLLGEPDDTITAALKRISQALRDQKKLVEQLGMQ